MCVWDRQVLDSLWDLQRDASTILRTEVRRPFRCVLLPFALRKSRNGSSTEVPLHSKHGRAQAVPSQIRWPGPTPCSGLQLTNCVGFLRVVSSPANMTVDEGMASPFPSLLLHARFSGFLVTLLLPANLHSLDQTLPLNFRRGGFVRKDLPASSV